MKYAFCLIAVFNAKVTIEYGVLVHILMNLVPLSL